MKARFWMPAALAVLVIFAADNPASAQQPGSKIAVVDVAAVFKAHRQFNQSLEAMKADVEIFKNEITRETQRINQMTEELNSFTANSEEYKQREQNISDVSAKLAVYRNQKNREFLEREAKLYFDTYVAISRELGSVCEAQGYTLILRQDGQEVEVGNRASVIQNINRDIVYAHPSTDITQMLIERVNR